MMRLVEVLEVSGSKGMCSSSDEGKLEYTMGRTVEDALSWLLS
jgi:hypothetical protein